MSLRNALNIIGSAVTVTRVVETSDGMGGTTSTSQTVGLSRCALWSPGQFARYISDTIARTSTHVLVTLYGEYTFTNEDEFVTFENKQYKINGPSDNVANRDKMVLTPLELLS